MRLRGVELQVKRADEAADFLERVWGLLPVDTRRGVRYFRGTGDHPYILSIAESESPVVTAITFAGSPQEIEQVHARVRATNAPSKAVAAFDAPGGGAGFIVQGPEAQTYRFIAETKLAERIVDRDKPIQVTHAVVNSADVPASERFAVEVLGFKVSDRTKAMTFVRCNRKHHSIAYAHSDLASLNHIAFEVPSTEAVMRGIGRLRDAGVQCVWGPGRHGPGNNVFGYFIAPFGGIIEYTAEVEEVDDDYKVGGPEDWKWPPGRIDHWGISTKDTAKTSVAERYFRFANTFT
jgi:2,3-dihydroxy-p-cumate/2,3-dihydroxybenzoate 3,4-dioxygenase